MGCAFLTPSESFSALALVLQAARHHMSAIRRRHRVVSRQRSLTNGNLDTGVAKNVQGRPGDEARAEHKNLAKDFMLVAAHQHTTVSCGGSPSQVLTAEKS
jgi:hypothetical protein